MPSEKLGKLPPDAMADIYFNRMHYRAAFEVRQILNAIDPKSESRTYWSQVLERIEARMPNNPRRAIV